MTTYILKFYNTQIFDYIIIKGFESRQAAYNYVAQQPHDWYQIFPEN